MELTVIELFAGVGGFRVGLNKVTGIDKQSRAIEEGNWQFVWANQYEPSTKAQHAFDCYTTRFGVGECSNLDINDVDKSSIPNHTLLVGGFPCQDYSVARSLHQEKGIEGKKGVLFWAIRDILLEKKPPFVLLENVDRLLKSPAIRRGRDFAIMLKTFDELGYDVQWRVINAGEYGMPQKRRRVFIFAYRRELDYAKSLSVKAINLNANNIFNQNFPIEKIQSVEKFSLRDYADTLEVSNTFKEGKFLETGMVVNGEVIQANPIPHREMLYTLGEIIRQAELYNTNLKEYQVEGTELEKWQYLKGAKKIERVSKTGHAYVYSEGAMSFPEKLDEPARTMLTSEGTLNRSSHVIFDTRVNMYRKITPIECELIQMFPINWTDTMPKRNRYFMMGNALVTGIISRLESTLRQIIQEENYL